MVVVKQLVLMRCWDCGVSKYAAIGSTVSEALAQAESLGWVIGHAPDGMSAACPECRRRAIESAREGAADIAAWLATLGEKSSIT